MAITAITGAAAQLPTTPTLPSTGQIGWTGPPVRPEPRASGR